MAEEPSNSFLELWDAIHQTHFDSVRNTILAKHPVELTSDELVWILNVYTFDSGRYDAALILLEVIRPIELQTVYYILSCFVHDHHRLEIFEYMMKPYYKLADGVSVHDVISQLEPYSYDIHMYMDTAHLLSLFSHDSSRVSAMMILTKMPLMLFDMEDYLLTIKYCVDDVQRLIVLEAMISRLVNDRVDTYCQALADGFDTRESYLVAAERLGVDKQVMDTTFPQFSISLFGEEVSWTQGQVVTVSKNGLTVQLKDSDIHPHRLQLTITNDQGGTLYQMGSLRPRGNIVVTDDGQLIIE